jgi:hydroxymethylpyrimidine/phosphomethylpyrimidine kinase
MQTVLTIAGFDPSSGAGVTADLMVFAAHSLFGTSCITALTVQSTMGVRASYPVAAEVVRATLEELVDDLPPAGIKIGMLGMEDNILTISRLLAVVHAQHERLGWGSIPVVLDPVMRSSSGRELLDRPGVEALRCGLLRQVDWVTPNTAELEKLSGVEIHGREDIPLACSRLRKLCAGRGPLGIVATGGHLDPPDDFLVAPDGAEVWLPGERVESRSTHGTGCAFSSAFLSRLVLGEEPVTAAKGAKKYVAEAIRTAENRGQGTSGINLLWPISK